MIDEDEDENKAIPLQSPNLPEYILNLSKSIVKIEYSKNVFSGFLYLMALEAKHFLFLFANKEFITEDMIEGKKEIKFYYDNGAKSKIISLNREIRYIKDFSCVGIDSVGIEILPSDNIEEKYFISQVLDAEGDFIFYKNKEIVIVFNSNGVLNYSSGIIEDVNSSEFTHSAKTEENFVGNPIFIKDHQIIVGIEKKFKSNNSHNIADFIEPALRYFANYILNEIYDTLKSLNESKNLSITENKLNYLSDTNCQKGIKDENGIIKYENGNYYQGEEKDCKRNGKGKEYYKNGDVKYDGDWIDDLPEGEGKYIDIDGKYYVGQFKRGVKNGKGAEYDKDNNLRYEGDFINGKYEGNGKLIYANGECYNGLFKDGLKYGKGTYYYKNGKVKYEGDFINDVIEGNGKLISENNYYYIGEIKNNSLNGKGILYYKDDRVRYKGEFLNGKYEWNGQLTLENGITYKGLFKNGLRNGKGIYCNKKGDII